MTSTTRDHDPTVTPDQLGVGLRLSLHPHCDDFVPVILGALEEARTSCGDAIRVETDEVSSYVAADGPEPERALARYAVALVAAAHRRSAGGHVVAHLLFSRGCPGEASCDLTVERLPAAAPVGLEPSGVTAAAQWSLYPLLDGGGSGDHMAHIEAGIAEARRRGTAVAPAHYATLLRGDLAEVLATAVDTWAAVGAEVPHVVTHLTVSVGSPSGQAESGGVA